MIWGYPSRHKSPITTQPSHAASAARLVVGLLGVGTCADLRWCHRCLKMRDFTQKFIVLGFHIANIKTNHWILGCPIRQSNKYHGAENGDMTGVLMGCEMMWIIGTKTWESSVGNYPKGPNSKHQKGGSRQQIVKWTATTGLCWQKFRGCL